MFKSILKEVTIYHVLVLVALVKVAIAPLSIASALVLFALGAIVVSKVIIRNQTLEIMDDIAKIDQEVISMRAELAEVLSKQENVFKQAEETQSVLSKFNLSNAFSPKQGSKRSS